MLDRASRRESAVISSETPTPEAAGGSDAVQTRVAFEAAAGRRGPDGGDRGAWAVRMADGRRVGSQQENTSLCLFLLPKASPLRGGNPVTVPAAPLRTRWGEWTPTLTRPGAQHPAWPPPAPAAPAASRADYLCFLSAGGNESDTRKRSSINKC